MQQIVSGLKYQYQSINIYLLELAIHLFIHKQIYFFN